MAFSNSRPLLLWASGACHGCWSRQAAFALGALAGQLASTTNGFSFLASLLLRGLFVIVTKLHFAENAFALQLLLQCTKCLVNIVIANNYLQAQPPF